jgi:hypothetical protein
MLILGKELAAFLQARRIKNKQSCQPGKMYCFRCRAPRMALIAFTLLRGARDSAIASMKRENL